MHKVILPLVALTAMALSLSAATTPKSKKKGHSTKPSAPTHASRAPHAAPASKGTRLRSPKATQAPRASKYTRRGKKTRASVHYQMTPTPERYQEIQQALASKGYFHGELNGAWGPDSIDALKRFQADQNLMPDGKIGSLSLIALGLGPKRLTASKSDPGPSGAPPAGSQAVPQGPGAVAPPSSAPAPPVASPGASPSTSQQ